MPISRAKTTVHEHNQNIIAGRPASCLYLFAFVCYYYCGVSFIHYLSHLVYCVPPRHNNYYYSCLLIIGVILSIPRNINKKKKMIVQNICDLVGIFPCAVWRSPYKPITSDVTYYQWQ